MARRRLGRDVVVAKHHVTLTEATSQWLTTIADDRFDGNFSAALEAVVDSARAAGTPIVVRAAL